MKNGFVFACNSSFFEGMKATINSLNCHIKEVNIEVLDTGLNLFQIDWLQKQGIRVISISEELEAEFTQKRSWHTDFSVYGSIFIDKCSYDNVIFLDSDLIILDDISDYFNKIETYKVVGTKANSFYSYFNPRSNVKLYKYFTKSGYEKISSEVDVDWEYITFNTGFWGINLNYYRKLKKNYYYLLKKYEKEFTFHDQSFINLILSIDKKLYYDAGYTYNLVNVSVIKGYYDLKSYLKYLFNRQIKVDNKEKKVYFNNESIKVIHYTGAYKPWNVKLKGSAKKLWSYYFEL